jgi:hypothetical protein
MLNKWVLLALQPGNSNFKFFLKNYMNKLHYLSINNKAPNVHWMFGIDINLLKVQTHGVG